jgi:predicted dehydrogenase
VAAKGINADAHKKASYDAAFAVEAEPEELDPVDFEVPEDLPENIFADMVGAIRDGKPLQCDGREGRKSVALFEAIYRSSDQESWVRL